MKNRFLQFTLMVILAGFGAGFLTVNAQQNEGNTGSMSATEYFAKIRNNQHSNAISPMDMYKADKQVAAMRNSRSEFGWDFVGPTNMAGPIRTLIVDNRDASGNTLYAGSIQGGLWKSVDNGNVWNEVAIDTRLNISSICQTPDGTIYVATGVNLEPYENVLDMGDSYGKGIYKSTDGTNFSLMPGTTPANYDLDADWMFIYKLAADGNGNIYAATNTGLKYFDATVSPNANPWTTATADGVELTGIAYDVEAKGNTVIAAVENTTYLSHNGHTGFANITGDDPGMLPAGQVYTNAKFDIATANHDYIYAVYVTNKGRLSRVFVSKDNGASWSIAHPGYSNSTSTPDPMFGNGNDINNEPSFGKSYCCILSNPLDPNKVFVGGKVLFEGTAMGNNEYYSWAQKTSSSLYAFNTIYLHAGISNIVMNPSKLDNIYMTTGAGISVTTDNMQTLNRINRNLTNSMYFTINANKQGDVIAGSYQNGVHYIDHNVAKEAVEMLSKPKNGGINPFDGSGGDNHISFLNPNFFICSGTGDKAMWRSDDRGVTVETLREKWVFEHEFISPFIMWETRDGAFAKDSMNFVATKDEIAGDTIIINSRNGKVPFYHVLEQDLATGDTIKVLNPIVSRSFVATRFGAFMNTSLLDYSVKPGDSNLGAWWQLLNTTNGQPSCMALSHNSDVLWVGTDAGSVYRISNLREAYSRATATIGDSLCIVETLEIPMGTQAITTISVDPQNSDNVLIGLGNYGNTDYVKVSIDANAATPTFNSAQGNLPQVPVYASTFESNKEGFAFVGTDRGLYYTKNIFAGSVDWTMDDSPFGDIPVTAIKQQDKNWGYYAVPEFNYYSQGANNYGEIYIGTFGKAIYKTAHFVGIPEIIGGKTAQNELFVYPNPATNQASIEYTSNTMGEVQVEVYDVTGKMVMQQVYTINPSKNTLDLNIEDLNNGMYLIYLKDGVQKLHTKLMITK